MKRFVAVLVLFVAIGMALGPVAWAGDTDPSGAKLRGVVDQYLQSASDGDADADTLRKGLGSSNQWNPDLIGLLCTVEIGSGIGRLIWDSRLKKDQCKETLLVGGTYKYCVNYTEHCNHYVWDAGCLKSKGCPTW